MDFRPFSIRPTSRYPSGRCDVAILFPAAPRGDDLSICLCVCSPVCLLARDGLWLHLNNAFRLLLWSGRGSKGGRASKVTNERANAEVEEEGEEEMRFSLGWFARGREEVIDEQAGRRGIVSEARHERAKIMKISR